MGKISNFTIFFVTISILTCIVITKTTMQVNKNHEEKLLHAMQTKIEYYAKKCYLEEKCKGTIVLEELYKNQYLEEIVHPITKEFVDFNTSIRYDNNQIIIDWK